MIRLLEPYAMKVARTVLRRGKPVRAYLFRLGRSMYYGSYKAPRTLVWVIGTVILILMIAIGFLGYLNIAQNDHNIKRIRITILTRTRITIRTTIFNNKRYYSTSRNSNTDIINDFIISKNLKPVFIYDNLYKDSVRKIIAK